MRYTDTLALAIGSKCFVYLSYGGLEGDRTLDLRVANAALSQLSYEPINNRYIISEKNFL